MAGPLSPAASTHQSSRPPDSGLLLRDFDAASLTSTVTTTGIDVGAARHPWELIINVSARVGTDPTLNVGVKMSDDDSGTNATILASSVEITEVGRYAIPFTSSASGEPDISAGAEQLIRQFLSATFTIGGTGSPGFTFSAVVVPRNHP